MAKSIVSTEILVLGGGIAGLACASEISKTKKDIVLIEAENDLCQHTSSHNSEVIHSGIYYKPGSLKSIFCVEGNPLLYEYCKNKGIDYKRIGKLIVLCKGEDSSKIEMIYNNGIQNRVPDLQIINKNKINDLESSEVVSSCRGRCSSL